MSGLQSDRDAPDAGAKFEQDKQDLIREAWAKYEALKGAPKASQALQDRILSELGVAEDAVAPPPEKTDGAS
jgi:hypothetical protein